MTSNLEQIKFDSTPTSQRNNAFVDGSDAYANNYKAYITFYYVTKGRAVAFKAFITNFSDTFKANWNSTEVYGRGDPIYTYKSTSRSPSLSFDVIASTDEEAYGNLEKVQKLAQFTYPAYSKPSDGPKIISNAPYVKIGFMNLLTHTGVNDKKVEFKKSNNHAQEKIAKIVAEYSNGPKGSDGLLVALQDVSFTFDLKESNSVLGKGAIFPRKISVNVNFYPIHQHELDGSTISENTSFPYATNISEDNKEILKDLKVAITGSDGREIYDYYADNFYNGDGTINNVVSEGRARQANLAETRQKVDIANARYNSLFGGLRYNRDANISVKEGTKTKRGATARENLDYYNNAKAYIEQDTEALSEPYWIDKK